MEKQPVYKLRPNAYRRNLIRHLVSPIAYISAIDLLTNIHGYKQPSEVIGIFSLAIGLYIAIFFLAYAHQLSKLIKHKEDLLSVHAYTVMLYGSSAMISAIAWYTFPDVAIHEPRTFLISGILAVYTWMLR